MMNNRRYALLCSLVALMTLANAEAQTTQNNVPRLVVNIVIDQLRTDYMEAFSPLYGEHGFKRLLEEGRVYSQVEYPFHAPDRASAVATLMSGCSPYENGIVGERWLDRSTLRPVYCADDKDQRGQLTQDQSSPRNLGVSTITDELKVSTDGQALVYAIAPNRDAAIFAGGHAADGAFWIDDESGQWASSSYYGNYPKWALSYDNAFSLPSRIDGFIWTPQSEVTGGFNYFYTRDNKKPFKHAFSGAGKYREYKTSALVNDEVNKFVLYCVENTDLGKDAITDFLNVSYYAGPFNHLSIGDCPMEMQDTYARLDQNLASLLDAVENRLGKGNVLFVVTSTGYCDPERQVLDKFRIPTGEFNITRAQLLLNMYLIAVYGQGQYVEAVMGNEIYLNLKLIENRGLNLAEVLERSQDFLIQLSGVRDVYTSQRLALGAGTPAISRLRNAYNPKASGDILVQVAPGWHIINEQTHEDHVTRDSYMAFPLVFLGATITKDKIQTPVTIDQVAPTVAQILRIRSPNGCAVAPLPQ